MKTVYQVLNELCYTSLTLSSDFYQMFNTELKFPKTESIVPP